LQKTYCSKDTKRKGERKVAHNMLRRGEWTKLVGNATIRMFSKPTVINKCTSA